MAGRFRDSVFRKDSTAEPPDPRAGRGSNRSGWYRRKAVGVPLLIFAGLLLIGIVGNIVDPPHKTVVRAGGAGSSGTSTSAGGGPSVRSATPLQAAFPDSRTKTSLCRYHGALPDHACTPGALNPAVTQATISQTICSSRFTDTVRPSTSESERMKEQAGLAYGVTDTLSDYQGDHLIPLELGGATDDLANFWDQPNRVRLDDGTVVTSDQKDALENALNSRVCAGQMTLLDAQRQIATDWYAASTSIGRSVTPAATSSTTTSTVPRTTSSVATAAVATTAPRSSTAPDAPVSSPPATSPTSCPNGSYVNVSGNTVCSPYAAQTPPAGATAQCNDGTYSMSQHRQGTCSGHGGVRSFL